jgi:hypothetical protein
MFEYSQTLRYWGLGLQHFGLGVQNSVHNTSIQKRSYILMYIFKNNARNVHFVFSTILQSTKVS